MAELTDLGEISPVKKATMRLLRVARTLNDPDTELTERARADWQTTTRIMGEFIEIASGLFDSRRPISGVEDIYRHYRSETCFGGRTDALRHGRRYVPGVDGAAGSYEATRFDVQSDGFTYPVHDDFMTLLDSVFAMKADEEAGKLDEGTTSAYAYGLAKSLGLSTQGFDLFGALKGGATITVQMPLRPDDFKDDFDPEFIETLEVLDKIGGRAFCYNEEAGKWFREWSSFGLQVFEVAGRHMTQGHVMTAARVRMAMQGGSYDETMVGICLDGHSAQSAPDEPQLTTDAIYRTLFAVSVQRIEERDNPELLTPGERPRSERMLEAAMYFLGNGAHTR